MDQGFTSGDAGVAEVAGDFLVNVGGMKKGRGAVEERDEGKSEMRMAAGHAAELTDERRR